MFNIPIWAVTELYFFINLNYMLRTQNMYKKYKKFMNSYELARPERIYNSHYSNGVPAMFTS